ncbi:hypothetical protein [Dyadobacter sp. MSC1_007]|uniref:hypothetical protein n=1 Tax=Dyadobacter sp. MSC1_007 TaxID=2909264 RepID=UPI00202F23A1|nr:hypothetical protein [Dyadobacter sp. MSC1_007]
MDTFESNIIGLRISGGGVSLSTVTATEVGTLIAIFENLILENAKAQFPELDIKESPILHFHEVRDQSVGVYLKEETKRISDFVKEVIKISFISLTTAIHTGKVDEIDEKSLRYLSSIQGIIAAYGAEAELKWNDETLVSFDQHINFEVQKAVHGSYSGTTTIIGVLNDVGGLKANIHLNVGGKNIVVRTSKEAAKKLAPSLYENVVLRGVATWDSATDELIAFKLDEPTEFKAGGTYEAILSLREITSGYWDNFNSNEEINEALLRD